MLSQKKKGECGDYYLEAHLGIDNRNETESRPSVYSVLKPSVIYISTCYNRVRSKSKEFNTRLELRYF